MYNTALFLIVIIGYIFAAIMWLIPATAHMKWATYGWAAGYFMAGLWIWYAYRNYAFISNPYNVIDEIGAYYNLGGVIVLDVCSFTLAQPYFKHIKSWTLRRFKK